MEQLHHARNKVINLSILYSLTFSIAMKPAGARTIKWRRAVASSSMSVMLPPYCARASAIHVSKLAMGTCKAERYMTEKLYARVHAHKHRRSLGYALKLGAHLSCRILEASP
jgi:hypothetical protein